MRRWGIVVSVLYAVVLVMLLTPACALLAVPQNPFTARFVGDMKEVYGWWPLWAVLAMLIAGQSVLLFVSVDTTQKRLRPRSSVWVSVAATSMLLMLLTIAGALALDAGIYGEKFGETFSKRVGAAVGVILLTWAAWGAVFYWFATTRNVAAISRAMNWLLRGSVLELLVAVPCHVIVRRRDDCTAPIATSYGITTGIAVMLASFGPGVLMLYKKRLDRYKFRGDDKAPPELRS
ncbi:MAG TPA: hypothetical protein VKB38_19620 [Terracidiphilus sp.]|nr:hypothetical protein [Terracidiphilus sp.]